MTANPSLARTLCDLPPPSLAPPKHLLGWASPPPPGAIAKAAPFCGGAAEEGRASLKRRSAIFGRRPAETGGLEIGAWSVLNSERTGEFTLT